MKQVMSGRASLAVIGLSGVVALGVLLAFGPAGLGGSGTSGDVRKIPPSVLMPKPGTATTEPVVPPEPEGLLPEYKRLIARQGTILRKAVGAEGAMRTVFRSADEQLELVLLENLHLQMIEDRTDYGKKNARVLISGTVYKYRGANYLLLTEQGILQP